MLFTVTSACVKYPYEKNPTQAAVVIDGEANVDGEISDEHLWLKPGAFEPGDKDGTFLVHGTQKPDIYDTPGSKKKKLNKNSGYGKFLKSFEEVAGLDVLESAQDPSRNKYEIWDVLFWEGMVLDVEMVDEPFDFKNDAGEQITGSSRQPYVRGYEGKSDGTSTPAAASTPASNNGSVDPKKFDSHLSYLEAYVAAGGDTGDEQASKTFYESARS